MLITDNMPEQKKNQDCIGFGTEQVVFREHRPPETRTKLHYFTLHERDVKGVIISKKIFFYDYKGNMFIESGLNGRYGTFL